MEFNVKGLKINPGNKEEFLGYSSGGVYNSGNFGNPYSTREEDNLYRQYKNNMNTINQNKPKEGGSHMNKKNENENTILETIVMMKIKSDDKDDWIRELKITMIVSFPTPSKQQIVINITDPQDPLFLYILEINEQEFHFLKQELCLLIEFQHFPQKFFEMLDACLGSSLKENSNFSPVSPLNPLNASHHSQGDSLMNKSLIPTNYISVLHHNTSTNEALLIIQEITGFRQLNHLILRFKPASDTIIKKYLSNSVKDHKIKIENFTKENSKLLENLENFQKENKYFKDELSTIKNLHITETENLKIEHQKEINFLKENMFEDTKTKLDQSQKDKEKVINEFENKIYTLTNKIEELTNDKLTLEDLKIKHESSERDLIGKNNILNSELKVYKEEVENLRSATSNLNHNTLNQEKSLTELKIKNESLNSQLEEKEKNILNLSKLVDNLNKQKSDLEENLKLVKNTNNKLEDKLQASIAEINKGNDIIQKLQADLKSQKEKIKLKQQAIKTQEQLINQKQLSYDDLLKNFNETKRDSEKKEEELKSHKDKIDLLKLKIEEGEKKLEENTNVITYLNQRLNETYTPFKTMMKTEGIRDTNYNFNALNSGRTFAKDEIYNNSENNKLADFNNTGSSFGGKTQGQYFNSNAFQSQSSFSNQGMIMPETNFTNFINKSQKEGKEVKENNTNQNNFNPPQKHQNIPKYTPNSNNGTNLLRGRGTEASSCLKF